MISGLNVLVVEDDMMIALDIADTVAQAGGHVVGPVPRVRDALALITHAVIDAAVLDANLLDRNITPVVTDLLRRGTPLVVYTGAGLPTELKALEDLIPVIAKPAPSNDVIKALDQAVVSKTPG